jgi:gliding motility-associated lipoprotein GldD
MLPKIKSLLALCFFLSVLIAVPSCKENYTPRSKGYIRIDYPEKKYQSYQSTQGFNFEYPRYATVKTDSGMRHPDWLNLEFPQFNGTIYLSYIKINGDPGKHADESRDLAYKHTIKAESIQESMINLPEQKVYGIFYDIKGNAASSIQFFVTDSLTNFLRGSLYFNAQPNQDSLGPVIQFIRQDIDHLIKSLEWKSGMK